MFKTIWISNHKLSRLKTFSLLKLAEKMAILEKIPQAKSIRHPWASLAESVTLTGTVEPEVVPDPPDGLDLKSKVVDEATL